MAVGSSGFVVVQPRAGILVLIAHNPEEVSPSWCALRNVDRINSEMSNLKFIEAMFPSEELSWAIAGIAAHPGQKASQRRHLACRTNFAS